MLEAVIRGAVRVVEEMRLSVRFAASRYGMTHTALHYRIWKISNIDECNGPNVSNSRYTCWQFFNVNQPLILLDCAIKCSKLNYGMTYKQFRQLANGCGRRLQSKFSSSWIGNKIAGCNWLLGFVKIHKNLTVCKSENKSLSRTTEFNETNVM